jgi:predicted ATPase
LKLQTLKIQNLGPISQLDISPREDQGGFPVPIILVGKNGSGKSLVLSAILDAITEIRRRSFREIPETDSTSYVRISSKNYISGLQRSHSQTHVTFTSEKGNIEFTEVVSLLPFEEFQDKLPDLASKITNVNSEFSISGFYKNLDISDELLPAARNLLFLYFPYFRYESPHWMSDKVNVEFAKSPNHYGIARLNPIRVNIVEEIRKWVLNLLLDREIYEKRLVNAKVGEQLVQNILIGYDGPNTKILVLLNQVLSEMLRAKDSSVSSARIGVGPRTNREISVFQTKAGVESVVAYDITQLSSGELITFGMIGEIIRCHEVVTSTIPSDLGEISGIVLVDEIDLHLHLEYQMNVLPRLLRLFPGLQFVLTTHSPLFVSGMASTGEVDIIEMPLGQKIHADDFSEFNESYRFYTAVNDQFKEKLQILQQHLLQEGRSLVITEGKTDWKHLKAALELAKCQGRYIDLDIEFLEYDSSVEMGDVKLSQMCEYCAGLPNSRSLIFLFDRDNPKILKEMSEDGSPFKSWGNNVFSLCLPVPDHRQSYSNISIEHFYRDDDIRTRDPNSGKRLWWDNEIEISYIPASNKREIRILSAPIEEGEFKKKIHDKSVELIVDSDGNQVGLSKSAFAELIISGHTNFKDYDRAAFDKVFTVIATIPASVRSMSVIASSEQTP